MMLSSEEFREIEEMMDKLLEEANDRDECDALNGKPGGYARIVKRELDIYRAGLQGRWPEIWKHIKVEAERRKDPQYAKYLELKKKFE